jgi:glycosyltransferase involved in cell wall biosynthesis
MPVQFHLLSFEGPDPYALAGGIGTRVSGLADALADMGFDTHLWFVGEPTLPGHQKRGKLHLHRWCQWMSRHYAAGVYDGQDAKVDEYARTVAPAVAEHILAASANRQAAVVLAEEWHTVGAVLHLDELLRFHGVRDQTSILWNANNTFGFHGIDWRSLSRAALITTVSRYMKHLMRPLDVDPMVIPNGLSPAAFGRVKETRARQLRAIVDGRTLLTKVARWDPDKRWLAAVEIVASLKRAGARPLLVARGGVEEHGREVMAVAHGLGLRVAEVQVGPQSGINLIDALARVPEADIVDVRSPLTWGDRRLLYRESAAVLANSGHEPFGLVGLEAMAVGGLACTGCSGEEYAIPGHNAIVLETASPDEFLALFGHLRQAPEYDRAIRAAGIATARQYAWPGVIRRVLLPRAQLAAHA